MKMVKSLLLGSAAGLVAVAGAQAADLPVKAKAVEYVKVCSLYGAGFYYIPGTDTCIKIGGFIRAEWNHNAAGSFSPQVSGTDALRTRTQNSLIARTRFVTSFDVRSQTEYGTLRAYARTGWQWTTNDATYGGSASTVYMDRAFIQFAGFTFGKTQSFFDTGFGAQAISLMTNALSGDTGGAGTPVAAYTWNLGNGVTGTVALEDNSERKAPVVELSAFTSGSACGAAAGGACVTTLTGPFLIGTSNTGDNQGNFVPDIVGNLRVDQAWGSAQIAGALHNVNANYYGTTQNGGHPDDKWGWAVTGGLLLKMPWDARNTLQVAAAYGEGATRYVMNPTASLGTGLMANLVNAGNPVGSIALAWADDGYFCSTAGNGAASIGCTANTQIELSKSWSITGGYNHYWTPSLQQSLYASYAAWEAPNIVNTTACSTANSGGAGCMDWSAWHLGSRVLWNPVSNLDIGLDLMYTKIDGANCGRGSASSTNTTPALSCGTVSVPSPVSSTLNADDSHVWSAIFRVQRNFWP